MKDIKLLLEKLRTRREKEFDKDVKILIDLKKHIHVSRTKKGYKSSVTEEDNCLSSENFKNCIVYVEKVYKNLKRKTLYEHSYYSNVINSYHKSSHYNAIMNYSDDDSTSRGSRFISGMISCINSGSTDNGSCLPFSPLGVRTEKNVNLIKFFHMYLIRKYCEKSFYKCLHSEFTRAITYNYLDTNHFYKCLESELYLLYSYIQLFSSVLLKNENINEQHPIRMCSELLSNIYEQLNVLRKKGTSKNVQPYDEEKSVPHNSIIKYVYFIVHFLSKNKNYNYLNLLYGIYSFIYIFSNVYYTCFMSFNKVKAEKYIEAHDQKKINYEAKLSSNERVVFPHGDKSYEDKFILYYKYINEYANVNFMELNEFLLYFLSKESVHKNNYHFNDIMKDLNIIKYATNLQKLFFTQVFTSTQKDDILHHNGKYTAIRRNICKKICTVTENSPLYLDLTPEKKEAFQKYVELIREDGNSVYSTNYAQGSNSNETSICLSNSGEGSPRLHIHQECLVNSQFDHLFFEQTTFNIDDALFPKNGNEKGKMLEGITSEEFSGTGEKEFKRNDHINMEGVKQNERFSTTDNDEKKRGWKEEKEYFLKNFNDIYEGEENRLHCIDEFYYIAIDFDKTIIKKDSYSFFFKMLERKYYKSSYSKGNVNKDGSGNENGIGIGNGKGAKLTQEDIHFFKSFSMDKMKEKKIHSVEERIEYLHKINEWFIIEENTILEKLEDEKNISEPYSDSYYYYLKLVDNLHVSYSMLIAYYDILKDINVDVLNNLINESYDNFQVNDYFLEVFLHLMNHKQKNRKTFYFDIITLNLKKQICLYTIRNNLLKVKGVPIQSGVLHNSSSTTTTTATTTAATTAATTATTTAATTATTGLGENSTSLPLPVNECTSEQVEDTHDENDYYQIFKKYFNVYYSKTHTYDKEKRIYTGNFEYNKLKIKHEKYNEADSIEEKVTLCSLFDKTRIKTKVCSLLTNINHNLSAFIGDSLIDLDAMLSADIPILIGHNDLLIKFCEKHSIMIKPLVFAAAKVEQLKRRNRNRNINGNINNYESVKSDTIEYIEGMHQKKVAPGKFISITTERSEQLNDIYDENKKIIYSTESWLEIGIFLFGDI
ncbi:conserved Plasmodium protein, unknown function [Plasmodium malariae]|uniref:Uncharacterized protein n=1 Tax=Plasmodium malariae TaxID=5858 RepID=A0A1C3KF91_PLAMA|nr:conserved Plasmodium protein, unknown function [Plasmodium malariae]